MGVSFTPSLAGRGELTPPEDETQHSSLGSGLSL